ncbi:MAG: transposase, partial [Firmicutes bacterium]|nr:transposase [Bacillota bacterium]
FDARPVYVQRDDRIKAHFMTCFISLLIFRILEKKLGSSYTASDILSTLREMKVTRAGDTGYLPSYTRTHLTDTLHETAGFRTDYEIPKKRAMQGVIRRSKGL